MERTELKLLGTVYRSYLVLGCRSGVQALGVKWDTQEVLRSRSVFLREHDFYHN
ncbi:MAG: hypothetical protein AAGA02_04830 [Bacteroidota bacterium]